MNIRHNLILFVIITIAVLVIRSISGELAAIISPFRIGIEAIPS